jgi:hypothetical protein
MLTKNLQRSDFGNSGPTMFCYLFVCFKNSCLCLKFQMVKNFSKLVRGIMLFQILFYFFSKVSNLRFNASKNSKCSKLFKQTSLKFYMLYQKLQNFMFPNVSHEFQHLLQICFTLNLFPNFAYFKLLQSLEKLGKQA